MRRPPKRHALVLTALAVAAPVAAQDVRFRLPLDCTLGEDCFIQQYVDRDPGPGFADFTGGALSYDDHSGTDLRVADLEAMAVAPPIVAPASGRVVGIRNNVADGTFPTGQDCGNGVAIDHGGGLVSQLCHMAEGSVVVRTGEEVIAGQPIGRIGLTGRTEFPHVHVSIRRDGAIVDPFVEDLWVDPVAYEPGGLLTAGFSAGIPAFDAIKAGTADAATMAAGDALVLWGFLFGGRAGDVVRLTITGPDGRAFFAEDAVLDRGQAQSFRAAGRRPPDQGWPAGRYAGTVELERDGVILDRLVTQVRLR